MKPSLALIALIGCSSPTPDAPSETAAAAAPPPPTMTLVAPYLLRGAPVDVLITGAPPNGTVGLAGTLATSGAGACPPTIAPLCLDIANPITLINTGRASPAGRLRFTINVPPTLGVPGVRLQAASPAAGAVSNVTQTRLLNPADDFDSDGLTNQFEHDGGLNPLLADTDGDDLEDGDEIALGLDPFDADTDGGGAADGAEVDLGLDPLDPADDSCASGSCAVDCAGVYGGAAEVDACGVCDDDPLNDCCAAPGDHDDLDGDGTIACFDCDDLDDTVAPGRPEVCDGVDNDCDGALGLNEGDFDGDGARTCVDCDDANPSRGPGFPELCDGVDNDCDGVPGLYEGDFDGDGARQCVDCDDGNPTRAPGLPELCDGLDNDCDGALPPSELDADVDSVMACRDCDDTNPFRGPGFTETCDGIDNDCDGVPGPYEGDFDGDGARQCIDCDDGNPTRAPGLPELCDGLDNDCDGLVPSIETDGDGDGLGTCAGDCDDTRPGVRPGQAETCDGVDNDCNPATRATAALTRRTRIQGPVPSWPFFFHPIPMELGILLPPGTILDLDVWLSTTHTSLVQQDVWLYTPNGADVLLADDEGGFTAALFDDDAPRSVTAPVGSFIGRIRPETPLAPVVGQETGGWWTLHLADGPNPDGGRINGWRLDVDMTLTGVETDADLDGLLACNNDCDDSRADVGPGKPELCDGIDNDCDGVVPADELDVDGDNVMVCQGDCNDTEWEIRPGGVEVCNGLDDDCSGAPSAPGEGDADGDGVHSCQGDCNDSRSDVRPGIAEACDRIDTNCDGTVPTVEFDADGDGWAQCAGDCGPADAFAYPSSPHWGSQSFTHTSGGASYDYNCDGVATLQRTTVGAPCGGAFWICSFTEGWETFVPNCGASNKYFVSCPPDLVCSLGREEDRAQACN